MEASYPAGRTENSHVPPKPRLYVPHSELRLATATNSNGNPALVDETTVPHSIPFLGVESAKWSVTHQADIRDGSRTPVPRGLFSRFTHFVFPPKLHPSVTPTNIDGTAPDSAR